VHRITVIADMYFRIPFKSGCDGFPGFIQLLHAFMPIGGMSWRATNRDTLSLPLFTLHALAASEQ